MAAPEARVQDVNARRVRLRVVSEGEGPPLLLLHDFLMDHRAFDDVVPGLRGAFRLVMPDLPGFGESEKPPPARFDYGVEAFADCVTDLVAALDLGRAHVIAHGMGGAIALALAAERPELIDRLVLVSPLVYPHARGGLLNAPVLGGLVFKQFYGRALFRGYFRDRIFSPGFAMPLGRIDGFYERFNSPPARESAYATMNALADTRPTMARLARVKRPTFVVWGRADALHPPQLGQRLAREVGAERFEIMEAGHAPYMELPEPFVATVGAFLRRRSPPV
ncbi:MAG TPA: alpha/beta hydrolase [Polyangiaceae bacterium]|nr:alpha/beta hydrolase [Polyangiaceae bacterium]